MKYINEQIINDIISSPPQIPVEQILAKTKKLQRLTLTETAVLLAQNDSAIIRKIYAAAAHVKQEIYGKRVVLFAPLYISNICANSCLYCAFRAENSQLERTSLTPAGITRQTEHLLSRGHKRILMVAGEAPPKGKELISFYEESLRAIYEARYKGHGIRRVNINCAPLSVEDFKILKNNKIGTYQLFQETYHDATYRTMHPRGPKSDADNRLCAIDRAFKAGIDDVGIGVLYGLYDYRFETLALLMHIEAMEAKHKVGPHTISVPRIEPAHGSEVAGAVPHKVTDEQFKKIVAILRLAVPYTGVILSTRETPEMRDLLLDLGVSQVSAESNTAPGGYGSTKLDTSNSTSNHGQFATADHRTLDEVVKSLMDRGYVPSFCTGCYRSGRTGEAFMDMAKPGTIKGKCGINALITLKEYLDDFAPAQIQQQGYAYIQKMTDSLSPADQKTLTHLFDKIATGVRDLYI